MGQRYRRMADQKLGPWLACSLNFAKWKESELKGKKVFRRV